MQLVKSLIKGCERCTCRSVFAMKPSIPELVTQDLPFPGRGDDRRICFLFIQIEKLFPLAPHTRINQNECLREFLMLHWSLERLFV